MPACAVFVPVFSAPIPHAEAGGPGRRSGFFSARAGNASVSALY